MGFEGRNEGPHGCFVESVPTAYRCQGCGTPLSWCSPRSANVIGDPATSGGTAEETHTLSLVGGVAYSSGDGDCDPSDVVAAEFDFAGVEPGAEFEAESLSA